MLTIYTIFMLSLVLAEKMWCFSADLRRRGHSRKVELLTMIMGCVLLGVGEVLITNYHMKCALQQEGLEKKLVAYVMLLTIAVVQLIAVFEAMKEYEKISDKMVMLGLSLFCLLVGGIIELI